MTRPSLVVLLPALARPRAPRALVDGGRRAVVRLSGDGLVRRARCRQAWHRRASFEIVALPPMTVNEDGRLVSLDPRLRRRGGARCPARHDAARPCGGAAGGGRHRAVSVRPQEVRARAAAVARGGAGAVAEARSWSAACATSSSERGDRQAEHDERARALVDRYFDAVLVHADPAFARLDEFFRPLQPMRTPVHYTGFVAGAPTDAAGARAGRASWSRAVADDSRARCSLTAIEAHRRLSHATGLTIVAGPLCDEPTWQRLVTASRGDPSIRLRRSVTDLSAEMAASRLSISQCGYNTALDIVRARVPALVVPFAERGETEQTDRARRLEALGALRVLPADRLNAIDACRGDRRDAGVRAGAARARSRRRGSNGAAGDRRWSAAPQPVGDRQMAVR